MAVQLPSFIKARRADLEAVCRRNGVSRLEIFGSAATGRFRPAQSDLDFLVEFQPSSIASRDLFSRYFGLKEDLERLFGTKVDLVMAGAPKNPYFIESLNSSRTVLYAQR
jgi:predicted nucleotidyltransferase